MGRETRAMQDDDATNPALLWVLDGEALLQERDCSRIATHDMKGVAARYPKAGDQPRSEDQPLLSAKPFPSREP